MSKSKNKKQKQSGEKPLESNDQIASGIASGTPGESVSETAEEAKRQLKNENMFRMWNARPTRIPSVQKTKDGSAPEPVGLPKSQTDWKAISIAATIICVLAIFSHIAGLFGQFVLNDQLILTPLRIGADNDVFWTRLLAGGLATPLSGPWTKVSLALDLKAGSMVWFHMVNLSLHAVASLYLFFLLLQVGKYWLLEQRTTVKPEHFAFAASGLFACHPLASEVISYIPGREMGLVAANYFLSMFFFFAAFVARKPLTMVLLYTAMFACVVMAAFSGPASITIPLALLTLALLAKPVEMEWSEFTKLRWPDLTIVGILAAAFIYLITLGIPTALNNGIGLVSLPFDQYLASQFKAFVTYFLRCFLVPGGLSVEPPLVMASGFTDPLALLGVAAVGGIAFLAYRYRHIPQVVLGLSLTLIGLFPDFVLRQSEVVSDARYYISLAGLAIVFGWGVAKMSLLSFRQVAASLAILFIGFAGLSNWRALAWSSEEKLWKEVLRTNAESARAHAKLGALALSEGKKDDAKKEIDLALKLDPDSPLAHLALGRLLQASQANTEAFKEFEIALKLAKDKMASAIIVAQCQAQVADALVRQGDYGRVKELVDEAKTVLGESAQLRYLSGMQLLNEKQYVLAIVELQQGFIQDQRNSQYVEPLAAAYLGSRLPSLIPQAYKLMERSVQSFPTKESLLLFARAAIELNRIDEARDAIENAAKLGGEDAQVFYLRSFIARAKKNAAQAAAFKAKALQMNPKIESEVPVIAPEEVKKYLDDEARRAVAPTWAKPPLNATTPANPGSSAPPAAAPGQQSIPSTAGTPVSPGTPGAVAPYPATPPEPGAANSTGK